MAPGAKSFGGPAFEKQPARENFFLPFATFSEARLYLGHKPQIKTKTKEIHIMKRFTKIVALGLTAACLAGCFTACRPEKDYGSKAGAAGNTVEEQSVADNEIKTNKAGGWEVPASTEMTEELRKYFKEAVGKLDGYFYEPVALLGTQIVSGTHYVFLCKSTIEARNAANTMKYTYIYVDLSGKASYIGDKDLALPGVDGQKKTGGWEMAKDTTITENIKKVLDKATETLTGATYTPVAYIGSQVVAGTNHAILCKSTPSVAELKDPGSFILVTIYEDLQGKCEITETKDIDLNFG